MKNCNLTISLSGEEKFTLEKVIDQNELGDYPLQAVAEFLLQNPDITLDLIDKIEGYYPKTVEKGNLANTTLNRVINTIPTEGVWPEDIENKNENNILYIDSDFYPPFTLSTQANGTPLYIVYRNGITLFQNHLRVLQSIKKLDKGISLSSTFKKIFEKAKENKEDLTLLQFLLDFLNKSNQEYLTNLLESPIDGEDPIIVIQDEVSNLLNEPKNFKYDGLLLLAINNRVENDNIKVETILPFLSKELLDSIEKDGGLLKISDESKKLLKKEIVDAINKDIDFPFRFKSFGYGSMEELRAIKFNKLFPKIGTVQQIKENEILNIYKQLREPYRGYYIYSKVVNGKERFYTSKTLLTAQSNIYPYNSLEQAKLKIDSLVNNTPILDGLIKSSIGRNEQIIYNPKDKDKVNTIITALDINVDKKTFMDWDKQLYSSNLGLFLNYLNTLKSKILKKNNIVQSNIDKVVKRLEIAQANKPGLESYYLAKIDLINSFKNIDNFVEWVISLLQNILNSDDLKRQEVAGVKKEKLKKMLVIKDNSYLDNYDNYRLLGELLGITITENNFYTKYAAVNKSKRAELVQHINQLYTELGFSKVEDVLKVIDLIDTPNKAVAFIYMFSNYNGKPIINLENEIIEPLRNAKTLYYQVVEKPSINSSYLVLIKNPTLVIYDILKDTRSTKEGSTIPVSVSKRDFLNSIVNVLLNKLKDTGYTIELLTAEEILNMYPDLDFNKKYRANLKGFVVGNKIIINSTYADLTTPLHEYMHIFLGILKAVNPDKYYQFLERYFRTYVDNLDIKVKKYRKLYPKMAYTDILEEILADDYAEYVVENKIDNIFDNNFSEVPELKDIFDTSNRIQKRNIWGLPLFRLNALISDLADEQAKNIEKKDLAKKMEERRKASNWILDSIRNGIILEDCGK